MHAFIRHIFYLFQNAIPLALIGLAVGVAILVVLNRKRHRDGEHFPKGQAVAVLLLLCYLGGLAAITFRPDGSNTGGTVTLGVPARRIALRLDWLFGRIDEFPVPEAP